MSYKFKSNISCCIALKNKFKPKCYHSSNLLNFKLT